MKKFLFLILILNISILCSCGVSANNNEIENQTSIQNQSEINLENTDMETYFYKYIKIGNFSFEDYTSYVNIIIPIKNTGDKDISSIQIWYQFIDINGNELSQELNFTNNLISGDETEMVSSYDLENVAIIRVNHIYMDLPDGSYVDFDLKEPIDYTYNVVNNYQSITYDYYVLATTLSKSNLSKNNLGIYEYNGISFITEDCDWIDNPLNTTGNIESGAFYRKMAMCLEGFYVGNNWSDYAEHIIGFIPNSKDDFIPYVENATNFIVTNNAFEAIINKFKTLSTIDNFDVSTSGEYNIIIKDTTICAEEMQISEEMLGYILAMITEYGADVSFDKNSCIITYSDYKNK